MRIHLTSKQWKSKGPSNVSARIRQRKSKKVKVVRKGQTK